MTDDGDIYEDVDEMRDAPGALRDHGLDPAGDDEHYESVERHDAKSERERIEFAWADVKWNECVGQ